MVKFDFGKLFSYFGKSETAQPVNTRFDENWRREFEQRVKFGAPFIITSIIAWPAYWMYRGYEWSKHKKTEALPNYIQKTFYQAKAMQFAIISAGLIIALNIPKKTTPLPLKHETHDKSKSKPKNKNKEEDNDIKEIDIREMSSTRKQQEEQYTNVKHGNYANDENDDVD